ncbi:MAG: hypothetical protein IKR76_09620 [Ruminococcus sp.]|nr:hypothetical protein [Ruminococcus sp.]
MTALVLFAVLVLLIVLERSGWISLSSMGWCVFMIAAVCSVMGLYVLEWLKAVFAIIGKALDNNSESFKRISPLYTSMSAGGIALRIILLVILFIPMAAGVIYIIQHMVRKPLKRLDGEEDNDFSRRCSIRLAGLGMISAGLLVVCFAVMVIMLIPYLSKLAASVYIALNPFLILLIWVFTLGVGFIYLYGYLVLINSTLLMILMSAGLICFALYLISFIFGVAAAVRAKRNGALTSKQAFVYSLLSLLAGWNFVVFLVLRKRIKEN